MAKKGKAEAVEAPAPAPDNRPVSPASVRTGTLLVTLALCAPALLMLVNGTLTLQETALRCAGAVLVSWVGVGCLTSLLRTYAQPGPPAVAARIGKPPTE